MQQDQDIETRAGLMLKFSNTIAVLMVMLLIAFFLLLFNVHLPGKKEREVKIPQADSNGLFTETAREAFRQQLLRSQYWQAPSPEEEENDSLRQRLLFGKDLIVNTALYFGPKGSRAANSTNGMNCQNCHLEAGTKVFGNNYGSVASTYPKYRARSGTNESVFKRVNDCFERSLNGQVLDSNSAEMQAILAYIRFLGKGVEKGKKAAGSGFKEMAYLDRAADPEKGQSVYRSKCESCHQANGEGLLNGEKTAYTYPPLWGAHSYNDAAGLYRLSNFARYVKFNMPLGVSHTQTQLSDEEAWDVAAFVNSQNRPHFNAINDWPNPAEKPVDHPFGPYADSFSEQQHKYGPYPPIIAHYAKTKP